MLDRCRTGLLLAALLCGCAPQASVFTEVVRPDDVLAERDLLRLLAVLESLDDAARMRLPVPFLGPPGWSAERTLPVSELLAEESQAQERAWSPNASADLLPAGSDWEPLLAAHGLSRRQFCGLLLAVGTAVARSHTAASLDLPGIAARGRRELEPLRGDERPFAPLPPEVQYQLVRRAAWLTIAESAARLAAVPDDNVDLVQRFAERLATRLPPGYLGNPLAGLYPRREETGLPFDEGHVSDAALTWSRANAIIGTDPPGGTATVPEPRD